MWALSTCGEPDEIKKNTHPTYITTPVGEQVGEHAIKHDVDNIFWMDSNMTGGFPAWYGHDR